MRSLFKKLLRFVWRRPSIESGLVSRFAAANAPYWVDSNGAVGSKGWVLIEGFHLRPNHVMQMARAAMALQERRGFSPMVLLGPGIYERPEYKDYYRSFGIHSFANIMSRYFMPTLLVRSLWRTLTVYRNLATPEALLEVTLDGLPIGELLYDSYLKEHGTLTVGKRGPHFLPFLFKSISLYHYYRYLVNNRRIAHVVLGTWVTAPFGLLLRIATAKGIPVTVLGGTFNRTYGRTYVDLQDALEMPLRPPENLVERLSRNSAVIGAVDRHLSVMRTGETDHVGVRSAYRDKAMLARGELAEALGLDPSLPNVFIMAHCFNDTPRGSGPLLFTDFYWWLQETMEATRDIPYCNWIIKPHPASYVYKELGAVEALVAQLSIPGLHLSPPEMSTASLIDNADALVTAKGSSALELACFGIPSVIAGVSRYSGYGIAHEPKTQEEYFNLLRTAHRLPRLTDEQIARAKAVVFLTEIATEHPSPILPKEQNLSEIVMLGDAASNRVLQSRMLRDMVEALESGCTPRDPYFEALSAFLASGDSHFYDEAILTHPEESSREMSSTVAG